MARAVRTAGRGRGASRGRGAVAGPLGGDGWRWRGRRELAHQHRDPVGAGRRRGYGLVLEARRPDACALHGNQRAARVRRRRFPARWPRAQPSSIGLTDTTVSAVHPVVGGGRRGPGRAQLAPLRVSPIRQPPRSARPGGPSGRPRRPPPGGGWKGHVVILVLGGTATTAARCCPGWPRSASRRGRCPPRSGRRAVRPIMPYRWHHPVDGAGTIRCMVGDIVAVALTTTRTRARGCPPWVIEHITSWRSRPSPSPDPSGRPTPCCA